MKRERGRDGEMKRERDRGMKRERDGRMKDETERETEGWRDEGGM